MRRQIFGCLCGLVTLLLASCQSGDGFTQQATTQFFVQDYNPEYLDVLWMVDDRSPMYDIRSRLIAEAQQFFTRLDAIPGDYRMAFVSGDMRFAKGKLKPGDNPVVLVKNTGNVESRANYFGSILSSIINLKTEGEVKGLEASRVALRNYFSPRENVPLVLVFISDTDDHSDEFVPAGQDFINYYKNEFLSLKGNRADLVKAYSINYRKLRSGETPTSDNRCATLYNAEIDQAGFKDRFGKLVEALGGAKGDLCSSFAGSIDLSGLRLRELPKVFTLNKRPIKSSLQVHIFRNSDQLDNISWTYDETSNQIVFTSVPPEGVTIQVTYRTE